MPIQISDNDTKLSFAYAVNYTQSLFEIKEEDSKLKTAGKVIGRIIPNAVLTILAAIETVVKGSLTMIAAIFFLISARPAQYFKDSTSLAARASKESFFGIFGCSTEDTVEIPRAKLNEWIEKFEDIKTNLKEFKDSHDKFVKIVKKKNKIIKNWENMPESYNSLIANESKLGWLKMALGALGTLLVVNVIEMYTRRSIFGA